MIFKPLSDHIVATPEKAATQSKGGILFTASTTREQPRIANVVAVGPNVKEVKVGDRFLHQAFSASDIKVGDDEYIVIREEFVMATIEEEK